MNKDVHDFAHEVIESTEEVMFVSKEQFNEYRRMIGSAIETQGMTTVNGEDILTSIGVALKALEDNIQIAEDSGAEGIYIKEEEVQFLVEVFGG